MKRKNRRKEIIEEKVYVDNYNLYYYKRMSLSNYEYGKQEELKHQRMIELNLGYNLIGTMNKYAQYDFFNVKENVIIELKSRRYTTQKHTSNLLGLNKFRFLYDKSFSCRVYLFYSIQGSLYRYQFHKDSYKDLMKNSFRGKEHTIMLSCSYNKNLKNILIDSSKFILVE